MSSVVLRFPFLIVLLSIQRIHENFPLKENLNGEYDLEISSYWSIRNTCNWKTNVTRYFHGVVALVTNGWNAMRLSVLPTQTAAKVNDIQPREAVSDMHPGCPQRDRNVAAVSWLVWSRGWIISGWRFFLCRCWPRDKQNRPAIFG